MGVMLGCYVQVMNGGRADKFYVQFVHSFWGSSCKVRSGGAHLSSSALN